MWDLIVSVPDHCYFFYFVHPQHCIAIALDEETILVAVHFSMKTVVMPCDHGETKGGANVNIIE